MLCCVAVAAGVDAVPEGAEASLRDALAAALAANRQFAEAAEELRRDYARACEENARLREENAAQAAELGGVDVLLLAVGYPGRDPKGFHYRIDTNIADSLYYQLKPKVILPGHYSNPKCTFKLAIVDEFLDGKRNVVRLDEKGISEVVLKKEGLPESTQIVVLSSVY